MKASRVDNQINFNGKIILGRHLSKNFEELLPELNAMLKEKPYDVTVYANGFYRNRERMHRITVFDASNKNYKESINYAARAISSTKKTRPNSYRTALGTAISDMDSQIEAVENVKRKLSLKNKLWKTFKNLVS